MLIYAAKRLGLAVLVALTVAVVCFFLVRLSSDVATALAGEGASSADIEAVRRAYGLDRPVVVQFFEWLGRALAGDFGESLYFKAPVAAIVFDRLPTTLLLGALALLFAVTLSIPLGVVAALRPNSWLDRLTLTIAVVGQAMPSFWFALLLILLF